MTVIRNANWLIAWGAAAKRQIHRRGIDLAVVDDRIHVCEHYVGRAGREIDGAGS